ncbi:MAG: DnaA N-terminal domain-containing protein, partial [Aminobacterium colombiense]|nr:DnaA N-terminal domain-containing protein [Aminobacterium colombiense]
MDKDINVLWDDILKNIEETMPEGTADLWLKTCVPLSVMNDVLVIDVPNVFVKEQISKRFQNVIEDVLMDKGYAQSLELKVASEARKDEQQRAERAAQHTGTPPRSGLNPNYI